MFMAPHLHDTPANHYQQALRRAFFRALIARLTGRPNKLLPLHDIMRCMIYKGQRSIGLRIVPINAIVGSAGRYLDFDLEFFPTQTETRNRWLNIDQAHMRGESLPPVELYKIGESYFVIDGNHRVSVARGRGQEFIDAYVIEIDGVMADDECEALASCEPA